MLYNLQDEVIIVYGASECLLKENMNIVVIIKRGDKMCGSDYFYAVNREDDTNNFISKEKIARSD